MMRKVIATILALLFLVPTMAMAEASTLPFGLSFGMDSEQAKAAFAADPVLSTQKADVSDYGDGAIEYIFEDVPMLQTDVTATNVSIQIDQNNSQKADRLSMVGFTVTPSENSIVTFRTLLKALTATLGAPDDDPFSTESADMYVEWGTLYASWTLPEARVQLNLNRMYSESITLQYNARLNYDKADLAE